MLLYASSDSAAQAVVRAFKARNIEAAGAKPRSGTYSVSIRVPSQREPEAWDIAKTIDPTIRAE